MSGIKDEALRLMTKEQYKKMHAYVERTDEHSLLINIDVAFKEEFTADLEDLRSDLINCNALKERSKSDKVLADQYNDLKMGGRWMLSIAKLYKGPDQDQNLKGRNVEMKVGIVYAYFDSPIMYYVLLRQHPNGFHAKLDESPGGRDFGLYPKLKNRRIIDDILELTPKQMLRMSYNELVDLQQDKEDELSSRQKDKYEQDNIRLSERIKYYDEYIEEYEYIWGDDTKVDSQQEFADIANSKYRFIRQYYLSEIEYQIEPTTIQLPPPPLYSIYEPYYASEVVEDATCLICKKAPLGIQSYHNFIKSRTFDRFSTDLDKATKKYGDEIVNEQIYPKVEFTTYEETINNHKTSYTKIVVQFSKGIEHAADAGFALRILKKITDFKDKYGELYKVNHPTTGEKVPLELTFNFKRRSLKEKRTKGTKNPAPFKPKIGGNAWVKTELPRTRSGYDSGAGYDSDARRSANSDARRSVNSDARRSGYDSDARRSVNSDARRSVNSDASSPWPRTPSNKTWNQKPSSYIGYTFIR